MNARPGALRSIVIGSSRGSCDVWTADPLVSAMHARITQLVSGAFMIEDLGSTNGTFMTHPIMRSESRILTPTILPVGARIRVGTSTLPWTVDR